MIRPPVSRTLPTPLPLVTTTRAGSRPLPLTRTAWLEPLKAFAFLWIFLNHVVERLFGSPFFGNPAADWPSLAARVAQLKPLTGFGIWNLPLSLLRDVGWLGDTGVTLFLMASGFGLAWSCLERRDRGSPLRWNDFFQRRLRRLLPIWMVAHLCFLFPFALVGWRLSLLDTQLYWSLFGIRILPSQLYYGVAAWWYVTLLLQLYLVFPLLWRLLERFGALRFLLLIGAVLLPLRAAGLFYFTGYLDAWSRGALFLSRAPEFALGMAAASWYFGFRLQRKGQLSGPALALAGAALLGLGISASFDLAGMTIAPLASGAGAFLLLYTALRPFAKAPGSRVRIGILDWIGRHSLSLFLVHQIFTQALVPRGEAGFTAKRALLGVLAAIVLSVAAAITLERLTALVEQLFARGAARFGRSFVWRCAAMAGLLWVLLISAELLIRRIAPQEPWDLGWGERAALQPHPVFGWNLQPSRSTRLRWESYDYRVDSNSLGFPGPEYSQRKPPDVFRVLVTGDAFSSAEGVDTNQSWPRLLEKDLAQSQPGLRPQVLDFSITGYGPNQYRAVIERFVPLYRPNLIVIGFFVNDYGDVLLTDEQFRQAIGFGKPDPNGLASIVTFRHLGALLRKSVTRLVYRVAGKADPDGYFLGQFRFIERDNAQVKGAGKQAATERLRQIKEIADRTGAKLLIVMIPAASQVCGPQSLPYWPKRVDVTDRDRFDIDLPQRTTRTIAGELGILNADLRVPLDKSSVPCPYQAHNMHWKTIGHQAVASYVASILTKEFVGSK